MSELPPTKSWGGHIEAFAMMLRSANRPESTIYLRCYHLRRFAATTQIPPGDVTEHDLTIYIATHKWRGETKRSVRASFAMFFRWAARTGRVTLDPTEQLPTVATTIGSPRPATKNDYETGRGGADERVTTMIELAALQGLRCCEIALVNTQRDIGRDREGAVITVHGKGRRLRTIPLNTHLYIKLMAQPPGWLFPGQVNGHLSAAYISKLISRALPRGVTAHMLRHMFASEAYEASGRDIRAVQELLGHASVATTQIYTAVPKSTLRNAVDIVAA